MDRNHHRQLFSLGFSAAGGLAVVDFRGGWEDLLDGRQTLKAGYGVPVGWLMFGSAAVPMRGDNLRAAVCPGVTRMAGRPLPVLLVAMARNHRSEKRSP
jgi:hypothetical protein